MATGPGLSKGPGGNADEAKFRQAMSLVQSGRPRDAELIVSDVLKRSPRNPGALHVMGCALLVQGQPADAIAPLQEAARLLHRPDVDTQLAIALRQVGRNDDALSRLKRAIKRTPPYAMAFHELGFLLNSMGRFAEAVDALKQGLTIAPMVPELSIQLGNVCLAQNDRAGARAAFTHALTIRPDSPDALAGIGTALFLDGERAAAADAFRDYLRVQPNDMLVRIKLGVCLLETGDREASDDCFRAVARQTKQHNDVLGAMVKAARGRFWLRPSDAVRFLEGKKD
jgi:Flp pilus assembly protein TadD